MIQQPIRQVSRVTTIPAPIRGINSYDSIAAMPRGFAVVLRNLYPQPFGTQVRRGYRKHCVEGIIGKVESLVSHNRGGSDNLYAFADDGANSVMYDVTAANTAAVSKITGLTNARWQHINFANAAGVHAVAVNGEDDFVWVKPDASIVRISAGDGTGNTIAGIDPQSCIQIYSHQKRIWLVEKNSTRAWYLPPDQITGTAQSFDFGPLWTRGGYLNQIVTWTIDDGDGADDMLAAISSEGQVAVYRGTDPDGADTWGLTGVYFAGAPVGRRAAVRVGGDIGMITVYGFVKLSDLLKSTKVNPTQDNDFKYIKHTLSAAVSEARNKFGWQPFVFPAANMFVVNIPITDTTSYQLVMNDVVKAWAEFIGYNAYCWELHDQTPFFGSFQAVYRAWEGNTDNATLQNDGVVIDGTAIRFEAQTAFDYFDSLGQQKHFKMVRPTVLSKGSFSLHISANMDFVFSSPVSPTAFGAVTPGVWDEDLWDSAVWGGGLLTFKNWQAVTGIGTAAALRLMGFSSEETYWASTDWLYEVGGVL